MPSSPWITAPRRVPAHPWTCCKHAASHQARRAARRRCRSTSVPGVSDWQSRRRASDDWLCPMAPAAPKKKDKVRDVHFSTEKFEKAHVLVPRGTYHETASRASAAGELRFETCRPAASGGRSRPKKEPLKVPQGYLRTLETDCYRFWYQALLENNNLIQTTF